MFSFKFNFQILQNIFKLVFQFSKIIYTNNYLDFENILFEQYAQLFIQQQSYWNGSFQFFGSPSSSETVSTLPRALSSFCVYLYGSMLL
jgi:hypothetical protein